MNPPASPPKNRMAIAILALLGFLIASYMLAYGLGLTGPVICGVGDCEAVQNSPYARIGPFPVAGVGFIGYLTLLLVALFGVQSGRQGSKVIPFLLVSGGVLGVLVSAYLTYLEAFVIRAWCQWCVGSAVVMLLAFLFTLPEFRRMRGAP
jgi:uncharacterized membrane protein